MGDDDGLSLPSGLGNETLTFATTFDGTIEDLVLATALDLSAVNTGGGDLGTALTVGTAGTLTSDGAGWQGTYDVTVEAGDGADITLSLTGPWGELLV